MDITEASEQGADLELDDFDPPEYEPDEAEGIYVSPADLGTAVFRYREVRPGRVSGAAFLRRVKEAARAAGRV